MKKRLTILVFSLLVLWNSFLTYELFFNREDNAQISDDGTVIQTIVTEFKTNLTDVVEATQAKVVGISAFRSGQLISSGSGAIVGYEDGVAKIITNNHVIEGGTEIHVSFINGEEVVAQLLGSDVYTDLALLSVNIDFNVEPFKFGDSSLIKVGENVLAIGSPLGSEFMGSVTFGIISGKDRIVPVDLDGNGIDDWDSIVLQTDAAINPGNSGGPLINMKGELIGINSMKIMSQQVEGMGFSIPSNEVVTIIDQLEEHGKVIRPVLGITPYSLTDMTVFQKSYLGIRLDLNKGLYISSVADQSPAQRAGLRAGDIITSFDGVEVDSVKNFRKQLYAKQIGDKVEISFVRNERSTSIEVVLE